MIVASSEHPLRAMRPHRGILVAIAILCVLTACSMLRADDTSAGVNGVNSRNLGLDGTGVNIGQIEIGRPGEATDTNGEWFWDYGSDNIAGTHDFGEGDGVRNGGESFVDLDASGTYTPGWRNNHPDVVPFFTQWSAGPTSRAPVLNGAGPGFGTVILEAQYNSVYRATNDPQISRHATQVAGVMIANGASDRGIATGAHLYSDAMFGIGSGTDIILFRGSQSLIRQVFDPQEPQLSNIRVVNQSWGRFLGAATDPNGSSQVTLSVDYWATHYDTLQVIAGDENQNPRSDPGAPSDLYNGINVSMLTLGGSGQYDTYDADNRYDPPANGRTIVQLCAPGDNINMPLLGGTGYGTNAGTSFAAPHVTAVTALLQQYGDQHRASDPDRWNADARRHQVMKAVLLNSADKLKDDGTRAPVGFLLGMEKTIYTDSAGTKTWVDSAAYTSTSKPLDDHIGAGALNAKRALKQFSAGEYPVGNIPVIGWSFATTSAGSAQDYEYTFTDDLPQQSFVSATLCWDRAVTLSGPDAIYDAGENFIAGTLVDLDLRLMRNVAGTWVTVNSSVSTVDSTEHIFFQLPTTGQYLLRVSEFGSNDVVPYGLAWWAFTPEPQALPVLLMLAGLLMRSRRKGQSSLYFFATPLDLCSGYFFSL